jgi:hypothetical protein
MRSDLSRKGERWHRVCGIPISIHRPSLSHLQQFANLGHSDGAGNPLAGGGHIAVFGSYKHCNCCFALDVSDDRFG